MTSHVQDARTTTQFEDELRAVVADVAPPDESYRADTYWPALLARAEGKPLSDPQVVVRPATVDEVSAVVRYANEHGIPVVPWGAGSGSQGGALATQGGILLDTRGLNRILDIDERSMTATVQTGMMNDAFEAALNERGLTYPHYPASTSIATVGGYVACRGSGVLSTKYGKIEDIVVSLQVVLPNGEIIRTLPIPRHAVGPDLTQLFTGSEGTFGIITEMTVRIQRLPETRAFHALQFDDIHEGIDAGRRIIQSGVRPAVMRLYDQVAASGSLGKVIGETLDRPTMVLVFEGTPEVAAAERAATLRIAGEHGARDIDPIVSEHWWEHRYDFYAPPHMPELPQMWGTIEIVAAYAAVDGIYDALRREIPERYADTNLRFAIHLSHWYDWGTMLYGRFIMPKAPNDPRAAQELHDRIWDDAITIALERGGVMNDHHGVGLKLGPYMRRQYGPAFDVLEAIKGALDPNNIMNPGKLGFPSRPGTDTTS